MTADERKRMTELGYKWLEKTITPEEKHEFQRWLDQVNDEPLDVNTHVNSDTTYEAMLFERIRVKIKPTVKVRRLWPHIAAAASILIALSAGGYFFLHKTQNPVEIAAIKPGTFKNDAQPGNKAILTLANGQQLTLTSVPVGHIKNTSAQKSANGSLVYDPSMASPYVYNTLTVPRGGGKHELQLADGTLAVLDAGSSIRFPVAFNGKTRKVSITGQVYFEVVHNAKQPFYVSVGNQSIEDIGTHFNINAFDNEIRITLLEGSVKVNNIFLKPGQQAVQSANNKIAVLGKVDENEVMAWKNDMFMFSKNTSLKAIMSQLSRWYDMDVVYQGVSKTYYFGGDMPRYSKLSDVLKILSYSRVQFAVDGKKIIVYQ